MTKPLMGLLAAFILLATSSHARANLIIMALDTNVNAGGTATVEVLIRSDGVDNVDLAQYSFEITALGGAVSTLSFSNPFDFSEDQEANYIFAGDSLGILDVPPNSATIYTAGDLTASGTGVNLSQANVLLARLDVTHSLGGGQTPAQANGEQFQISLLNNGDTIFEDNALAPVGVDPSSFAVGNSAIVTVLGAASVPEPSSLLLCGLSAIPLMRRRRR